MMSAPAGHVATKQPCWRWLEIRSGYAAAHRLTRVQTAHGPTYKPDYGPQWNAEGKCDRYAPRRAKSLWRQVKRRLAVI